MVWRRRVIGIGISRSLIGSKTLMELIFNPCGEFRWSKESPVSQIHSPHLQNGAPRIFSDLLRSVQMLKREWDAKNNGMLPYLIIPSKTATLVPEFAVKEFPLGRTAAMMPGLQWRTCPWAEYSDDIYKIAESNGKLPHILIPGKTAALVPEFAVEDLP